LQFKKKFVDQAKKTKQGSKVKEDSPKKQQGAKKAKKMRDPNQPRGRQTAFFIFLAERRAKIKAANPDFSNPQIAQEVARCGIGFFLLMRV
jgi:hypothetical protein